MARRPSSSGRKAPGPAKAEKPIAADKSGAVMPDWLSGSAQKLWPRVLQMAEAMTPVTAQDSEALGLYCEARVRFEMATKIIEAEGVTTIGGTGGAIKHPAVTVADAAQKEMRAVLQEFGLTPASRARVPLPKKTLAQNPFAGLLKPT